MERFTIRLAGYNIGIESRFESSRRFFADYIVSDDNAIVITSSVSDEELINTVSAVPGISREAAELTGLYRPIAEALPVLGGIVFHGAAISYGDDGYIFTAPSGTGKTTHIRMWKKYLGKNVDIVNGDKPVITVSDDGVYVHGTPWSGKERWQKNRSVPLRGICLLHRGDTCHADVADADELIPFLFSQTYLSSDCNAAGRTMELLDDVLRQVPIYSLYCDISENAVKCSFETLCKLNYDEHKAGAADKMKIKKGFVLRDIAGQAVATATGEAGENFRGMIKMNKTARDVWMWLDEGKSPEEISVLLSEKYNVPKESTFADVMEMIEKMEKAGFLEP